MMVANRIYKAVPEPMVINGAMCITPNEWLSKWVSRVRNPKSVELCITPTENC